MTKEEYFQFHKDFCDKMHTITRDKNADYTGASTDPFANFKQVEAFGVISTEQGMFTRMSDKFARLASFVKNGKLHVKGESVGDTLQDLANYCILLAGYIKSTEAKTDVEKLVEMAKFSMDATSSVGKQTQFPFMNQPYKCWICDDTVIDGNCYCKMVW